MQFIHSRLKQNLGAFQPLCLFKGKDFFAALAHPKHRFNRDLAPLVYFVSIIITNCVVPFYYTVNYNAIYHSPSITASHTKIVKYIDSKF